MPWAHADTVRSNVTSPAFRLHVVTNLSTDSGCGKLRSGGLGPQNSPECRTATVDAEFPVDRFRRPITRFALPGFADKALMRARQLGVMRRWES